LGAQFRLERRDVDRAKITGVALGNHGRGDPGGVPGGHRRGHDTNGGKRLRFSGQAASGRREVLEALRNQLSVVRGFEQFGGLI